MRYLNLESVLEWRKVILKGNETSYSVSNSGLVRNDRFGKLLKQSNNKYGYPCVTIYENPRKTKIQVHILVAQAFIDNPESLATVDHIDGDKTNNNKSNLQWMSFGDNSEKSNAKIFTFMKDGLIIEVRNLYQWCSDNGYNRASVMKMLSGKWKYHRDLLKV